MASQFIFGVENLLTFINFIILIPIIVILKFDRRIPILYALIMLFLAAAILDIYGNKNLANLVGIYIYWLLVIGIICLTIEYIKE